ncbi:hypothetical protein U1Q18_033920 [Sarracenia purpurea var. burkii]
MPVGRRSAEPSSASRPAQTALRLESDAKLATKSHPDRIPTRSLTQSLTTGSHTEDSTRPELGETLNREIASKNSPFCALPTFPSLAHPEIIAVRDTTFPLDISSNNRLATSRSEQNLEYESKRAVCTTGYRSS